MFQEQHDLMWLMPLFLAGLALLVAARLWWFVSQGATVVGVSLKPRNNELRNAAFATWLLALAALGFVFARL
jgi:hypothetical protein